MTLSNNSYHYFSISIFYNLPNSNILIAHCQGLLKRLQKNNTIHRYVIFLSEIQGSHFRIVICCHNDLVEKATRIFCEKMKIFLLKYPSRPNNIQAFGNSIFMNFPSNTILLNHFKMKKIFISKTFEQQDIFNIRKAITDAFFTVFSHIEPTKDSLRTFSLYLQLINIRLGFNNIDDALIFLRMRQLKLGQKIPPIKINLLEAESQRFYFENFNLFNQILNQIWNLLSENIHEKFVNNWKEAMISLYNDSDRFSKYCPLIADLIFEHIGLVSLNNSYFSNTLIYNSLLNEKNTKK